VDGSVQGTVGDQRRSGVRRRKFRSIEQKRQMVQETLEPGASVAVIARRHGVTRTSCFPGDASIGAGFSNSLMRPTPRSRPWSR
jgi:hypothetical protein